jgi:Cdc6-like AAA superfamily ATPase
LSEVQIVIVAALVAAGVALVGLLLMRGEAKERERAASPDPTGEAGPQSQDPVQRLSETLQALRKLSELRDEEEPVPAAVVRPPQDAQVQPAPAPATDADPQRDLRILVGEAFTPSAPVSRRDLFAGRTQQMEDLVDTVYERGQHAVIYGERGVGKTSIATVMTRVFDGHETQLGVRVNCDSSDTYGQLWQKVFEQVESLAPTFFDPADGGAARRVLEEVRAPAEVVPNDVRRVLAVLAATKECVIFIDEFDTLRDPAASRLFADTIKMLSDQLVPATMVLIGVADDLDELIEEHGSVRRALIQIHMPRMSTAELAEIVEQGLGLLNMKCAPQALDRITHLSQGFPHYTHLLAQASARTAIDADRTSVELEDVDKAIGRVVDRVHQSIREAYEIATVAQNPDTYPRVLAAAALAARDDRGFFTSSAVKTAMAGILGHGGDAGRVLRPLNSLCDEHRGSALQRKGSDQRVRFRFTDPLLQPYVVMKALQAGIIDGDLLDEYTPN